MDTYTNVRPVQILLVEDNSGDVRLTIEALKEAKVLNKLMVVKDGVEALLLLRQEGQYAHVTRPGSHPARPQPSQERWSRGAG